MILFRPVGKAEYDLIAESGFTAYPPRLPEQPIFYPVLNEKMPEKLRRSGIGDTPTPSIRGMLRPSKSMMHTSLNFLCGWLVQAIIRNYGFLQKNWIILTDISLVKSRFLIRQIPISCTN
mgnify:CR=1 FL=1